MSTLSAYDAKAQWSAVLDQVEGGETVIITRHGKPIAKVVPLEPAPWKPVLTTLPELKVGGNPDDFMAPVFPDGIPWSPTDPV